MKYALEPLETLLLQHLHPERVTQTHVGIDDIEKYLQQITAQKNYIRSTVMDEVFLFKKEEAVTLFIHRYQVAFINLSDEVSCYTKSIKRSAPSATQPGMRVVQVYEHVLKVLEELLKLLEKQFPRHFNRDEQIPETYKAFMQKQFIQDLKLLSKQLQFSDEAESFTNMIFAPFHKFIKISGSHKVTYRELQYLQLLWEELSKVSFTHQTASQQKILDRLVYLNFNSYFFVNYYIDVMAENVNSNESLQGQIEQLAWWAKIVSQIQIRPNVAYNPGAPSAKEQLLAWLSDELIFLEKKQQLYLASAQHSVAAVKTGSPVTTSLSVKQVALLTRLLFDTGIIKFDNQTELLTRLAGVIKTERKENISAQNLRVKYYNIDEPTKRIVKEWLFKLTDQLRKY